MSVTLEILGPDELPKRIQDTKTWFNTTKRKLETPARLKRLWLTIDEHFYRNGHSERDGLLAWHLGLKDAFSDSDLFCEWLPWELCCPKPCLRTTSTTA